MDEAALKGKTALITGAASGIGRAMAMLFARHGATVCAVDLEAAGVEEVADGITSLGGIAIPIGADVTRATDCKAAVEARPENPTRLQNARCFRPDI